MYPVISPESVRQATAVWCSSDRLSAWNDLTQRRVEPAAKRDCDAPVAELVALPSGEMHSGAMKITDLVPLLDAAGRK